MMTVQPSLRELLAKALTEWGDTASWYVFAAKDVDELLTTPSGKAIASHFEREAALEGQVLRLGGHLPDFDHWREHASSKPSDPTDIRWECICGYANSPEKVKRHWAAALGDTP